MNGQNAPSKPIVLCVDDEKLVLDGIKEQLRRNSGGKFIIETAESGEEALELFRELLAEGRSVAVVISDHIMPRMKGTELLARTHNLSPLTLTILLTGQADADAVGKAVNEADLYRYIAKPWSEDDLILTVREALRRFQTDEKLSQQNKKLAALNTELQTALGRVEDYKKKLEAENVYLRQEVEHAGGFSEMVGQSQGLKNVLAEMQQVAQSESSVLVTGESGTGKELIARGLHQMSDRRERPLVKVNCASLPANLVESEIFGHERGAFTGANSQRIGRFELADNGTLFLDEIGELPLELQAKFLRVLQEGEFERLGGTRTLQVNVRIIAATNRDLRAEVAHGRFREDLYYRLNVFPIHAPALRERAGDIPGLLEFFVARFAARMGKTIDSIPAADLARLSEYSWPGNIRELSNVAERSVILSNTNSLKVPELFSQGAQSSSPSASANGASNSPALDGGVALSTLREVETDLILQALERCAGVIGGKKGAASLLDIPPSTLRERMQRYGIKR